MSGIFTTIVVQPFYNALILLVDFLTNDLGVAIIILTVLFRLVLFPLSKSQIKTQLKMRQIQKPLNDLKEKYKKDPQKMAEEMMKLYKENEIKPFSGILMLFIQLPLLIGFYQLFLNAGLPNIDQGLLYSFVPSPESVNIFFLGIVNVTEKSAVLAALVGLTQYFQAKLLIPKDDNKKENTPNSTMEEVMKNMQTQMVYVLPIVLCFVSYFFGSIIAIYLLTSNLFSIAQEYYVRKRIREPEDKKLKEIKI
jgi:YidC/Oxa1 family membrane protein insertase